MKPIHVPVKYIQLITKHRPLRIHSFMTWKGRFTNISEEHAYSTKRTQLFYLESCAHFQSAQRYYESARANPASFFGGDFMH